MAGQNVIYQRCNSKSMKTAGRMRDDDDNGIQKQLRGKQQRDLPNELDTEMAWTQKELSPKAL